MQPPPGDCPICNSTSELELLSDDGGRLVYKVGCPRCAQYFITDFSKDRLERALQLNDRGIEQYVSMDSLDPNIALLIEVAKKATAGRSIDINIPRSIISHIVRNRMDKRAPSPLISSLRC